MKWLKRGGLVCLLLACVLMTSCDKADNTSKTLSNSKPNQSTNQVATAHQHSWGDWVVIKDATCEDKGYQTRACLECDSTAQEYIDAKGHSYVDYICTICKSISPERALQTVKIANEAPFITLNERMKIEIETYPLDAIYEKISYKIDEKSNTCGAIVTEDGVLSCVKAGSVRVCVTIDNVSSEYVMFSSTNGKCGENVYWTLEDNTQLIIQGKGEMVDCDHKAYPWYNNRKQITEIIIYDGVTSIGEEAFWGCKELVSVKIPNGVVSIGEQAFDECEKLSNIIIPDSVTVIGGAAFTGTPYYKDESNWKDGVLYMGNHLIEAKESLEGHYTIKEGTISIGAGAFLGCRKLTSITIPNSVTIIGEEVFASCTGLTSITIPYNVTSIGYGAFYECTELANITILGDITSMGEDAFYGTAYCKDETNLENGALYIGKHLIAVNPALEGHYNIKEGTLSIGKNAFYNCTGITGVTMPDSVTIIGSRAFYGCAGLTGITIPDGVTSIGDHAFYECTELKNVKLFDGITEIGYRAFYGCAGLTSIAIPDSVTSIGEFAFYECTGLKSVIIGNEVTSIGGSAFGFCTGLTSITIPDSVTSIGDHAFYGCTGLTSVTIGNNVKRIGERAFNNCYELTSITIPSSVTEIGEEAFYSCHKLKSAVFEIASGWRKYYYGNGSETLISKDDLSNPTIAAEILRWKYSVYEYYTLKRS